MRWKERERERERERGREKDREKGTEKRERETGRLRDREGGSERDRKREVGVQGAERQTNLDTIVQYIFIYYDLFALDSDKCVFILLFIIHLCYFSILLFC